MVRDTDYLSDLVNYVKRNLKKGYSKEVLRQALTRQDHSKLEIERAFAIAHEELAKEAPVLKTKPKIRYELVEYNPVTHAKPESEPEKKSLWKKWFG